VKKFSVAEKFPRFPVIVPTIFFCTGYGQIGAMLEPVISKGLLPLATAEPWTIGK